MKNPVMRELAGVYKQVNSKYDLCKSTGESFLNYSM